MTAESVRLKNISCPTCKKQVSWEGNPDRPFCSERCRQIDLGAWASGEYCIAGADLQDNSDDEQE